MMPYMEEIIRQAKHLERIGKYSDADALLGEAIQNLPEADSSGAPLFNTRGLVRRMQGDYDGAFRDYESALCADPALDQQALAHINKADIYRVARTDFPSAHVSLDEALTVAGQRTLLHAKAVDQRGLVFFGQGDYASALAAYQRAREICEALLQRKSDDSPPDQEVLNRFAQVVLHQGGTYVFMNDQARIQEAYDLQQQALGIFRQQGDWAGVFNTFMTLGQLAQIQGDTTAAIQEYHRAEEVIAPIGEKRGIACLAMYLAESYLTINKAETALPYLERLINGVHQGDITTPDRMVLKERFAGLASQYNRHQLQVEGFDDVKKLFF